MSRASGRDPRLPRFVVFGEALTDLIRQPDQRWLARPGGAPWNVARVAARLGVPTAFAGAVSCDVFGDALREESRAAGLDLRFLQRHPGAPLLAVVPETAPPRYFFVGDGSADLRFDPAALPPGWLEHAEVAHFGSISLAREPLASRLVAVAERCRGAGMRITFDPNHRSAMGSGYGATLERLVRLADVVKVSDEDLRALFPADGEADALAALRAWNPRAVILYTLGAAGMRLLAGADERRQAALVVEVADTVGAGDAAVGGWVASWLSDPGAPLDTHLTFAAATAAAVCRRPGACAPSRREVEALLAG